MQVEKKHITVGSVVGVVASLVAIWATVPWAEVMPPTHAQHDADIEEIRKQVFEATQASDKAIEQFYRNWKCDEWIEELDLLLERQHNGDGSPQLAERISRLRDKIDENDCADFDE